MFFGPARRTHLSAAVNLYSFYVADIIERKHARRSGGREPGAGRSAQKSPQRRAAGMHHNRQNAAGQLHPTLSAARTARGTADFQCCAPGECLLGAGNFEPKQC